jgi:hypothetical protein
MARPASVTAEELLRALKRRRATLPGEIGSFMVLEVCEALLVRGPELVGLSDVHISEEGSVWLPSGTRCADTDAAVALHRLLASVLVAAGPAPLPALMRLLEQGPSSGQWTLAALRDDLEASLVPLNRGASRRVLARFVREIGWAERAAGRQPTFNQLDSELNSFLGVEEPAGVAPREPERPAAPKRPEPPRPAQRPDDVEFFESLRPPPASEGERPSDEEAPLELPRPVQVQTVVDPPPSPDRLPARSASESPGARHASLRPPLLSSRPPRDSELELSAARKKSALLSGGLLLALSVAVLVITFKLRPELSTRLAQPPAPEPAAREPSVVYKRPASADLVVRVATDRAQVLRLIGRGPVSVPHLPLGIAHEFVAVAEGYAPARLLIPADAEWETTPDGRRYEAAMQLSKAAPEARLELGDSLLPQNVGVPSDALGTVRIVTTPRGAQVYQVIGFAPEARVEQLPLDATQELLIYRKGYLPELRAVTPGDYSAAPDGQGAAKRAELDISLVAKR